MLGYPSEKIGTRTDVGSRTVKRVASFILLFVAAGILHQVEPNFSHSRRSFFTASSSTQRNSVGAPLQLQNQDLDGSGYRRTVNGDLLRLNGGTLAPEDPSVDRNSRISLMPTRLSGGAMNVRHTAKSRKNKTIVTSKRKDSRHDAETFDFPASYKHEDNHVDLTTEVNVAQKLKKHAYLLPRAVVLSQVGFIAAQNAVTHGRQLKAKLGVCLEEGLKAAQKTKSFQSCVRFSEQAKGCALRGCRRVSEHLSSCVASTGAAMAAVVPRTKELANAFVDKLATVKAATIPAAISSYYQLRAFLGASADNFPYVTAIVVSNLVVHALETVRIVSEIRSLEDLRRNNPKQLAHIYAGMSSEEMDLEVSQQISELKTSLLNEALIKGFNIALLISKLDRAIWQWMGSQVGDNYPLLLRPLGFEICRDLLTRVLQLPAKAYRAMVIHNQQHLATTATSTTSSSSNSSDTRPLSVAEFALDQMFVYLYEMMGGTFVITSGLALVEAMKPTGSHFLLLLAAMLFAKSGMVNAPPQPSLGDAQVVKKITKGPMLKSVAKGAVKAKGHRSDVRAIWAVDNAVTDPVSNTKKSILLLEGKGGVSGNASLAVNEQLLGQMTEADLSSIAMRETFYSNSLLLKFLPILNVLGDALSVFLLYQFSTNKRIYSAIGMEKEQPLIIGLEMFLVAYSPLFFFLDGIKKLCVSAAERKADELVQQKGHGEALKSALQKIYKLKPKAQSMCSKDEKKKVLARLQNMKDNVVRTPNKPERPQKSQ
mmetsp:Transcript_41172/g.66911  ORF Transcript_41172/g.66911 Transcript_41172/m.66911 type:complete len:766 (+) Transcript_41172:240-2537(+)